jgi:hypothetical protein
MDRGVDDAAHEVDVGDPQRGDLLRTRHGPEISERHYSLLAGDSITISIKG